MPSVKRRVKRPFVIVGVVGIAMIVSACGELRRTFALERRAPDEFVVVSRAPLSLPPDYALRPPRPGAPRPQETPPSLDARDAVLETVGISRDNGSGRFSVESIDRTVSVGSLSEARLLQEAGAIGTDGDIRRIIDEETTSLIVADRSFVDSLIFWRDPQGPESVVDAPAEARRIQDNQALGDAVTGAGVPTIERKRSAPLEGIF